MSFLKVTAEYLMGFTNDLFHREPFYKQGKVKNEDFNNQVYRDNQSRNDQIPQ